MKILTMKKFYFVFVFLFFVQSQVVILAQAGQLPATITTSSAANTSSNRLNAPVATGTLSETNYTVSLSMPNSTGNGTSFTVNTSGVSGAGLTQFNNNYATTNSSSLKGYYITRNSNQPFQAFTTGNATLNANIIASNRAIVQGVIPGLNSGSWLYNEIETAPTAAASPPLQQQGSATTAMASQSVNVTFFNPGVYYVWAYVTGSNFFYFSNTPLLLTVYPINFSSNNDGTERLYCNLDNSTFSGVTYARKTAQGYSYSYKYFYKNGNGELTEAQGSDILGIVYDGNAQPYDFYFYVARGYTVSGTTYW